MKNRILSMFAVLAVAVSMVGCTEQTPPLSETVVSETTQVEVTTQTSATVKHSIEASEIKDSNSIEINSSIDTVTLAGEVYNINEEKIFLGEVPVTDEDINKLLHFKNLKSLSIDLYTQKCEVSDLSVLSELNTVEKLYINGTYTDLAFINGMSNLTSLTLEHFFCESLENVPYNTTLTSFSCSQSEISDLSWIANFDVLKELCLSHFVCADYSPIGEVTNLEVLEMFMIDKYDVDLQFMGNLTSLKKFNYYPVYKTLNFDSVSKCNQLTELEISADINNLDFTTKLLNLQIFSFYAHNQNSYDIAMLKNCKKLENVQLTCQYSEEDLNELKQNLPECKFN